MEKARPTFMGIPAELRERIYAFALPQEIQLTGLFTHSPAPPRWKFFWGSMAAWEYHSSDELPPALMLASKQVLRESKPTLLSRIGFRCDMDPRDEYHCAIDRRHSLPYHGSLWLRSELKLQRDMRTYVRDVADLYERVRCHNVRSVRLVLKDDVLCRHPVQYSYRNAVRDAWLKRQAKGKLLDLQGCLQDVGRRYFQESDWHTINTRPAIAHMARASCTLQILMPVHRMQVQASGQYLTANLYAEYDCKKDILTYDIEEIEVHVEEYEWTVAPWQKHSIHAILEGRRDDFRMPIWSDRLIDVMMYGELLSKHLQEIPPHFRLNIEQSQELSNVRIPDLDG